MQELVALVGEKLPIVKLLIHVWLGHEAVEKIQNDYIGYVDVEQHLQD